MSGKERRQNAAGRQRQAKENPPLFEKKESEMYGDSDYLKKKL